MEITNMQTPLRTFTNEQTGMQANIYANTVPGRYNVVLKDLDSGETVPYAKILNDLAKAEAYALTLV